MKKIFFVAALAGAALMTACCDKNSKVTLGSLSGEMDSLSYALGVNIGTGLGYEMKDIPFDYNVVGEGLKKSALGKSGLAHEEALETIKDFFMNKRPERSRAIAKERAKADSIRQAAGDTTKVEYPVADEAMFESEEERREVSLAFGSDIGYNIRRNGIPVQVVWLLEGMQDVRDNNPKMDNMQANQFLQNYFMVQRPAENKAASQAWLEKIEKKSGVKKTESGLLYKVVKAGDETAKATDKRDTVKVHYTGRTRDGKVFDSSIFKNRSKEQQEMLKQYRPDDYDKDEPIEFPLNRVIPGWAEGVQLVGKGGKIMLWIPAELAYGERGAGSDIGPNDALEFEIELIDVKPYVEPAPADSTATDTTPEPAKK